MIDFNMFKEGYDVTIEIKERDGTGSVIVQQQTHSMTWYPLLAAFIQALHGSGFVGCNEKIGIKEGFDDEPEVWVAAKDANLYE